MRRQRQRVYVLFILFLVLAVGVGIVAVAADLLGKANLFVLLPTYGVMLLSVLIIIGSRLLTTRHALNDIPKDYLPIQEYHVPKGVHKRIHQALADSVNVNMEPDTTKMRPLGWGPKGSATERIHLKTFVAMSYQLVVKTITEVDQTKDRLPSQSVRKYLHAHMNSFNLDAALVEDYINMYELARFGPDQLTESDYDEFTTVFYKLLESIKSARPNEGYLTPPST